MKKLIAIACAIMAGTMVYALSERGPLQKADFVHLITKTAQTTPISLITEYRAPERHIFEVTGKVTHVLDQTQWHTLSFNNTKHLGNILQFEITNPGTVWIKQLVIFNRASNHTQELSAKTLYDSLFIEHEASQIELEGDSLRIDAIKPNAKLTLQRSFNQKSPLLQYGLAIIFALITFLLITNIKLNPITAINDIDLAVANHPGHRTELDGIRGLAALLVVLEHTWGLFAGIGLTGVWLFFILSGYLLSKPFIAQPSKAVDLGFIGPYLYRRLTRILPLYFTVLVVYFAFNGHIQVLIDHLFFINAQGHFWTIPQELAFYLVLPVLMVIAYAFYQLSPVAGLGVLLITCTAFLTYPAIATIQLYGNGIYRYPLLGWFLLGVCLSGLHHTLRLKNIEVSTAAKKWLSGFGIGMLVALLISSTYRFSYFLGETILFPLVYGHWYGIAGTLVIFCALLSPGTLLSKILNLRWLRAFGVVGYSLYLIHPMVITLISDFGLKLLGHKPEGIILFLTTLALTWLISLFTYSKIERPFLSLGRGKSNAKGQT